MGKYKYRLSLYGNFDFDDVGSKLEEMERRGWRLDKMGGLIWRFRRIEPSDLNHTKHIKYTVAYLPELSVYDPNLDKVEEFREMCREAGWEIVAEKDNVLICTAKSEDPTPIETDENALFGSIKKGIKKTCLYPLIMVAIVALLNFSTQTADISYLLSHYSTMLMCAIYVVIFLMTIVNLWLYVAWARKSATLVEKGGRCLSPHGIGKVTKYSLFVLVILIAACITALAWEERSSTVLWLIVYVIMLFIVALVTRKIAASLRKKGVRKGVNIAVTSAACALMVIIITAGFGFASFMTITNENGAGEDSAAKAAMPLKSEDMRKIDNRKYEYSWDVCRTVFLDTDYGEQYSSDYEGFELYYEIVHVPQGSLLYRTCLKGYLNSEATPLLFRIFGVWETDEEYRKVREACWSADTVYRLYYDSNADTEWILCYDDRIVKITFYWEPDENDLRTADRKLSGKI